MAIAERGAFLARVNKGEVPSIWECSPACDHEDYDGGQDEALGRAIAGDEKDG